MSGIVRQIAVKPFRSWDGHLRGPFFIGDEVWVHDEKHPRTKYAAQLLSSADADGNVVVMVAAARNAPADPGSHVEVSRLCLSLRGD